MLVKIHGQEVQLETRVCVGGCGKKFRCTTTCPLKTARGNCVRACGKDIKGLPWKQQMDRARNWVAKYSPGTVPDPDSRQKSK